MVVRLRFAVAFVGLLSGCAPTSRAPEMRQSTIPDGVDHLVYAAADLEVGRDKIEQLLGVRPVLGGRHPQYGTHNALLSLGPATYLEIIAPDPELDVPERGVLFGADGVREPRLVTWALRSESIDDSAASASSAGVGLGSLDGAVPFLISWGATPHPAGAAPRAGELVGLRIEHPDPEKVREALLPLGVEIDVRGGEQFRLIARVKTARGEVQIR
jgi:hypothetical protein